MLDELINFSTGTAVIGAIPVVVHVARISWLVTTTVVSASTPPNEAIGK